MYSFAKKKTKSGDRSLGAGAWVALMSAKMLATACADDMAEEGEEQRKLPWRQEALRSVTTNSCEDVPSTLARVYH